jgi:tRNA A-37 threonylcarbamoyl transferase component Bud32
MPEMLRGMPRLAAGAASRAGWRWHVLPAGVALFGTPDPARWRAEGRSLTLKSGLQRDIERVELVGGAVVVKTCRVNGPRAWWREVFRGPKAKLEFDHALALRARGLAAAEPLAWARAGRHWPGASVVVSRLAEGVPLQEFLASETGWTFDDGLAAKPRAAAPSGSARLRFARELGTTLARMHEAGVAHPDPHPGNLLVTFAHDQPRFTLIDLHALRIGAPLLIEDSLDNLALFNRYFQLRATRTERLAFWRAYASSRPSLAGDSSDSLAKEVERRTVASNARFWRRRLSRYRATNRQYRRVKAGAVFGHAVRELPDEFVRRLLEDPDAPFADPAAKVLKDSRSSTVIELPVPTPTGIAIAIFKRFRVKSSIVVLKNRFRTSSALRSWDTGHNLLDRGLPTARPLLVLHRRRYGAPAEGYLLAERVPDARELDVAVAAGPKRAWFDALGRLIRDLHEKQVAHRDLKAANILMSGDRPVLIDLVGVEPGKPVPRSVRVKNLARLNASFLQSRNVTRTDRLRFLRAYGAWGLRGRADWKVWWKDVARATLAKVEKNRRTGRVLG